MKKMPKANKRRTRRSGSGLEQINGDCGGGEVNPATVDKSLQVPEQSNDCVPPKTPEADDHMEKLEESPNDAKENGDLRHHDEMTENGKGESNGVSGELTPATRKKSSNTKTKFSGSHLKLVLGLPSRGQFEIHQSRKSASSSKKVGGGGEKKVRSSSQKRAQKSEKAVASSSAAANSTPVDGPKKRKKNKKKGKVREDDEYTRIKKKLRYLLNRINYEQSLIDAYSLEGWKGSSAEKLRPEKELERATQEILKRKVKIRDLFQHLDTLCAEGNLPETLFDSDGEISSEDIFCAKCGSKDVSLDNDIILCDGFCDRGFHQYCVEPPLLKEDIPPDDEGWLCPACDCKDDSLDILNDSLGTKLTINDTWEKVFPEAAAALAGGDKNLIDDLPSDDSDDEEYDPNGLNDDENDEDGSDDNEESENDEGGSSADESDFTSASDDMIESVKEGKDIMDLPSDDSEDDDYDPDAPTLDDEDKMHESSNSDCTSDSEDLETSSKGDEATPLAEPGKSESNAELEDGLVDVPSRRNVERLDYKKLYDEEYENAPTSSSDDEDWDKKEDAESGDEGETVPVPLKQSSKKEDSTSTKKPRQRSQKANKKDTVKAPQKESPGENGSSGKKSSNSASKQTDPKTQRLFKSFQENRYPDRAMKESLAKELQMTVTQVNNWFKNRRSSTSKPLVVMVSKEDVEKLTTGKKSEGEGEGEGETSVGGSSKQAMETESVAKNKKRASESANPGTRTRRRR